MNDWNAYAEKFIVPTVILFLEGNESSRIYAKFENKESLIEKRFSFEKLSTYFFKYSFNLSLSKTRYDRYDSSAFLQRRNAI